MSRAPEPPLGSAGDLLPSTQDAPQTEGVPRDTEPAKSPSAESSSPDSSFAPVSVPSPQSNLGVQAVNAGEASTGDASKGDASTGDASTGDASKGDASNDGESGDEHSTLHSASHPGSGPMLHWDERRILHVERELDQLSARQRLQDKRLDQFELRLRAVLALGLLLALVLGVWLSARG